MFILVTFINLELFMGNVNYYNDMVLLMKRGPQFSRKVALLNFHGMTLLFTHALTLSE